MKDYMMDKTALYDGNEETTANTSTSWTISALAHQVGIDDNDIYTFLVNKGNFDSTSWMPTNLFTTCSKDSKREWFGISDTLKKDIVKATQGNQDSPRSPRPT